MELQFHLLEKLTRGWQEYNESNPEAPNTLFLVGDGMQSIYGFREANVGLFLEAKRHGVNGVVLEDLPLSVNFRSDPEVVEWNNRVFSSVFPAEEAQDVSPARAIKVRTTSDKWISFFISKFLFPVQGIVQRSRSFWFNAAL